MKPYINQAIPKPNEKKRTPLRLPLFLLLVLFLSVLLLFAATQLITHRFSFVILGMDGARTDVMMLVTADTKRNRTDVLSIPRDTYYPVPGYDGLGQKKINAVYGFKKGGNLDGVLDAVEELTFFREKSGTALEKYVVLHYDAVVATVDAMGGIEVDVPFEMYYDDPYADPPLRIRFHPGMQKLDGQKTLEFMRFRKNNDGTNSDGDIGRMKRQRTVLSAMAGKLKSPFLPYYVWVGLAEVETNVSFLEMLSTVVGIIGMKEEDLRFHTLPEESMGKGADGLYYYFHSPERTKTLMDDIFSE